MRSKYLTKKKLILFWILLYILILFFGILVASSIIKKQNNELIYIAQSDMEYYFLHKEFHPLVEKNDINNFIYDADNNLVDYHSAFDADKRFDFDEYVNKIYDKVHEKGIVTRLVISKDLKHNIAFMIGYPAEDDGTFIFLKELASLKQMIIVMWASVTVLIIICAIFTGLLLRKSNDFERMQREYVDNISHELKSPLSSVRALTTAIYDGLVKDENKQKHYCSIMLNEVNNLERTVSDMLELSRIQNKQISCEKLIYTGHDLFGAVVDKRKALCEDLNIDFRMSPQLDEYPFIYTNKTLASRLLDILLDNAIKFTPVDGIVHMYMTYNHRTVTITVRDSGPGIPAEDEPHIFERFYKSDKAHNEKGSGLGLAIAMEIAESLGEKLWISENGPDGASFSFTIHKQ